MAKIRYIPKHRKVAAPTRGTRRVHMAGPVKVASANRAYQMPAFMKGRPRGR